MASPPLPRSERRIVEPPFDIGHPYPERDRVSIALLWYGVSGGGIAWGLQHMSVYVFQTQACSPINGFHSLAPGWAWAWWGMIGINVFCILFALGAIATSVLIMRKASPGMFGQRRSRLQGHLGRSHWLATFGLWGGAFFTLLSFINLMIIVWDPLCIG